MNKNIKLKLMVLNKKYFIKTHLKKNKKIKLSIR